MSKLKKLGRNIRRYFIGVFREVKRIRWPKGKDLVKATVTVAIFAVFFGICLFSFDYIVIKLLKSIGFRICGYHNGLIYSYVTQNLMHMSPIYRRMSYPIEKAPRN